MRFTLFGLVISFFPSVRFWGDWEVNIQSKKRVVRIGLSQIAMWHSRTHKPIFSLMAPWTK